MRFKRILGGVSLLLFPEVDPTLPLWGFFKNGSHPDNPSTLFCSNDSRFLELIKIWAQISYALKLVKYKF